MVALVDPGTVGLAGLDLELELHRSLLLLPGNVESRVREHPEHGDVLGQDDGDEPLDAVCGRKGGQLLEQSRPDAPALELVRNCERDLGLRRVPKPVVGRNRDHALVAFGRQRPDQGAAVRPVRLEDMLDEGRGESGDPLEPQVEALQREALEEGQEPRTVGGRRCAEPERAPVSEDDVEGLHLHGHSSGIMPRDRARWVRSFSAREVGGPADALRRLAFEHEAGT